MWEDAKKTSCKEAAPDPPQGPSPLCPEGVPPAKTRFGCVGHTGTVSLLAPEMEGCSALVPHQAASRDAFTYNFHLLLLAGGLMLPFLHRNVPGGQPGFSSGWTA